MIMPVTYTSMHFLFSVITFTVQCAFPCMRGAEGDSPQVENGYAIYESTGVGFAYDIDCKGVEPSILMHLSRNTNVTDTTT